MRKLTTVALSLCLLIAGGLRAQDAKKPPLSPAAKATAEIGGKSVTIDYSAPSKRGRVIMGELVPYGKVWRTGANAATTLETTGDLMIGNLHVPAGKYSLFTVPTADAWTLVVSKQTGLWGTGGYDEAKDLGRVKMSVKKLSAPVETFAIGLKPAGAKNGVLSLSWENVEATVPVMVH
jgi:hypothetical protein